MTSPRPYAPETRSVPLTFLDCDFVGSLTNEGWYKCYCQKSEYLSCDMNRYKRTCPYGYAHVRSEV